MTFIILLVGVLSTCITYFISIHLKRGPILASAIVTLASGISFPYIFKDGGLLLAIVATTGSYAAMVTRDKFPHLSDMVFVGLLCGILFLLTQDVFLGVGGRLGSIGAISGLTWLGFNKLKNKLNHK